MSTTYAIALNSIILKKKPLRVPAPNKNMEAPHCSIAPRANDKAKSANAADHNLTFFFLKDILIALPYLVHYFFYFGPRPIIA